MTFPQFLELKFLEWQHQSGSRKTIAEEDQNPFWRCSSRLPKHTFITGHKAVEVIIPAIISEIRDLKGVTLPPARIET